MLRKLHSDEALLVGSNLAARGMGFLVSLLISRIAGVAGLGAYSTVMITSSSATTPLTVPLANHGTLMTAKPASDATTPAQVIAAQMPWFVLSLMIGLLGSQSMLQASTGQADFPLTSAQTWVIGALLVAGHLLTQWLAGVMHGANRSRTVALTSGSLTLVCALAAYPIILWQGLPGALGLALICTLGPGLFHVVQLGLGRSERIRSTPAARVQLRREAWRRLKQSLPNMGTAVLNTGTNWVCCIYLMQHFHGMEAVGMVALSLQWMMLMQLVVSSWGGKILHALALKGGPSGSDRHGLMCEAKQQIQRCAKVTAASGLAVTLATPLIAIIYKVDVATLGGLLAINAAASVLTSVNYVYERVFFLLPTQRAWLVISTFAYATQLGVTLALSPVSIMATAIGNLVACAITMALVRHHLNHSLS